jgi:hypothetical protein
MIIRNWIPTFAGMTSAHHNCVQPLRLMFLN